MLDVETLGAALKLVKEGGGGGGEGGAVIDDSKISSSTTWSSQKIVDTLCPPFTASGSVVQCTPVVNSPIDIQVEIEPLQEGTGDPSPTNVRPISGWDSVNVTMCGENLFNAKIIKTETQRGVSLTYDAETNVFTLSGTVTGETEIGFTYMPIFASGKTVSLIVEKIGGAVTVPSGKYAVAFIGGGDTPTQKINLFNTSLNGGENSATLRNRYITSFWFYVTRDVVFDNLQVRIRIELSSAASAYEPYQGETYTIQLGQTVYGGNVNLKTGKFVQTHNIIDMGNLTWTYNTTTWGKPIFYANIPDKESGNIPMLSPVYKFSETQDPAGLKLYEYKGYKKSKTIYIHDDRYTSKEEFKVAMTGTLIVYKLETPLEYDIDDNLTILALSGTNTIYADAGVVTVSGLSDTVETFNALENRIAALEEAAISG